tara:strand:+ start:377 stop:1195 length:819 start_codon:yes stop_codon:yes gene_type:complete
MFGVGVGIRVGGFTPISGGGGFDPDAQAFFDRVTAAGGTLTTTEKNATNQLVLDMKSAGIWSSMKAVYPMVGASAAACAQNLKSSSFTGTFTSGWTFASTGVTPNGTSAYMDTTLTPNGNLSQNDAHVSLYSRTNNMLTSGQIDLGCGNSGGANDDLYLSANYGPGNNAISNVNGSGFAGGSINTTSLGFFLSQRTAVATTNIYQNNTFIKLNATNSATPSSSPIYLGRNTSSEYSSRELAFASFGASFDATQRGNYYTAVQTFQTTLSRQV